MKHSFDINPNISLAKTLPSSFYRDEKIFNQIRKNIFLKSCRKKILKKNMQQTIY